MGKATSDVPISRDTSGPYAVRDPRHARTHLVREPGDPTTAHPASRRGPHREVSGRTPMMHDGGKSDGPIVPVKFPNKGFSHRHDSSRPNRLPAEGMEGRGPAEGNRQESRTHRTLCRSRWMLRALAPIRRQGLQVVHVVPFFTSSPEAGAQCGNPARWDLCGGRAERPVPTATTS